MAFGNEDRPDRADLAQVAFDELSGLVRNLGGELAAFRRRALQAEARVKALEEAGGGQAYNAQGRINDLERENADLRARLEAATDRTRQMLDRVRFLRQQHDLGGER